MSAVTAGFPSRSPPIHESQARNGVTRGGRVTRDARSTGAAARDRDRIERGVRVAVHTGDDPEERLVEEGERGPDLVERRHGARPKVGGPPQKRDLLAQPAPRV